MQILILIGSYRKNGNTARIVEKIEQHLITAAEENNTSLAVETLFLGHLHMEQCRGCRACFDRGEEKCPVKDDMADIREKLRQADGVLMASPVYVDDVSGISKTFIDRMAYACHRPEFAGKVACLVTTVGSSPVRHAQQTLSRTFSTWGFTLASEAGFKTGALMASKEVEARFEQKTRKVARDFFLAIQQRKFARPSFLSLMTFRIQQRYWQCNAGPSFDYEFWQSRGWTDPGCTFYIPHQARRLKVVLAGLVGNAIAPFVT